MNDDPIQWLKEQFEFEYCSECGGDWYDHNVILLHLGAYGGPYNFAQCKIAGSPKHKVRQQEQP